MDYKVMMQIELDRKWKHLLTFGESESEEDDEDEEVRLTALCSEILHDASEVGDLEKIILLIDRIQRELGIEINIDETIDQSNQTPLMLASGDGYPDIVEFLIQNGANVNYVSSSGDTPLIKVAQNSIMDKDDQFNIVERLITSGANVNYQDKYGKTPLILATESNSPNIVGKLLLSGADISVKDKDESTALDIAISNEMVEIEQIIKEYQNKENEPKTSAKKRGGTKKRKRNKRRQKLNKSKRRKTI
jgi:ankyrin repeat protein